MEASDAWNHVYNRRQYFWDKLTEDSPLRIARGYRLDGWYSCTFHILYVSFGANAYPLIVVATQWRWARLGTTNLTNAQPKCRLWRYLFVDRLWYTPKINILCSRGRQLIKRRHCEHVKMGHLSQRPAQLVCSWISFPMDSIFFKYYGVNCGCGWAMCGDAAETQHFLFFA